MNITHWLNGFKALGRNSRRPLVPFGDSPKGLRRSNYLGCEMLEDRVVPQAGTGENFVSHVYTDLLHRPVDPVGLSFWSSQINAGATREQVVLNIERSVEYRNEVVEQIFTADLHRPVDPGSLAYWSEKLGVNSIEQVQAAIIGSFEFFQNAGGTNEGFLQSLYQNVLNRPIDASGHGFRTQELNAGISRTVVAYEVLTSTEYRSDLVKSYYEQFLNRSPDAAGLSMWTDQLAKGSLDQLVIAKIIGSQEYQSRIQAAPQGPKPTLTLPPTQLNVNGATIGGVTVTATGSNSDPITFAASNLPPGLTINPTTGVISGTIAQDGSNNSPYAVSVSATQDGNTSTASLTWVVTTTSASTLPFSLTSPAWVTLPSGVRVQDVTVGTGTAVAAGDTATVKYTGYLTNGTVFDSNNNGFSAKLDTAHLIAGWVDAVPGMKPGGVRLLDIPASLAYGSTIKSGIPANSELIFKIRLIS